jgi:hypothetical protein
MLKYRHPILGRFEKLKLPKGPLGAVLVSESELSELLRYLNEAKTPAQKRILSILEQMLALAKIEPPIFSENIEGPLMIGNRPNPIFEKIAPEKYYLQMEIERRTTALNTQLAQYRFTPFVLTGFGEDALKVIWHRDWRSEIEPGKAPDKLIEGQNLELLLNLARSKNLNRLRRCENCKSWLYARFSHQNFCSVKCQQKHNTRSEEFKEHRRNYMRGYYKQAQRRSKSRSSST